MTLADHYEYTMFLEPFNFIGLPALCVPCGFCEGLPVGVQLVSRPWKEDVLISLAQRYQEVTDWHVRVPPRFNELTV
jgi:aspartyl-tRNA(Asn)/glutamyl-tRNA(Gln) amidotransferase subunit A